MNNSRYRSILFFVISTTQNLPTGSTMLRSYEVFHAESYLSDANIRNVFRTDKYPHAIVHGADNAPSFTPSSIRPHCNAFTNMPSSTLRYSHLNSHPLGRPPRLHTALIHPLRSPYPIAPLRAPLPSAPRMSAPSTRKGLVCLSLLSVPLLSYLR